MARGSESTADLYVRLGLSYDELESGFVNAERTIRDNMTRLSRENQIIDLQARVEIAGLDETADAEQILQIRTRALNQQLEHQRDRVRLASAELANMTDRTGENSDQTQRARLALERERLALAQLEEQLASLNDSQDDTSDSTDGLRERFSALAGKLAPVAAGFTAVIGAMTAAGEATKALIEDWRELQQQSYELNMSISDTRKLLRQIRLAGGDIGDFEGYIRGITDAYVKGEKDDPEFIALGRYGAKITDATGKLKDFKSITEEVYQAYLKAKAAGEEIEFLQMTGGESGVRDAIQLFERYAEAKEDAAKIVDAGLDQKQMHAAERSLNLLMEQMKEFKDAAVNVITPATVKAIDDLFGIFNAGTKAIKENTDTLRDWGSAIAEIASFMPGVHEFGWTWDAIKALANVESEAEKTAENIKKANDKTQEGVASWADYRKATEGATKSWGDFRRETDPKRGEDPLNQYGWQRLRDLKNEIEDIRVEIKNFNNDYKQSLAELGLEKDRALDSPNYLSLKEELAIRERYTAQLELLEKKRAEAIKEAREDVEAELGTDLDQQLLDFQRRKKDWISAGMDAAEAEILAEKLKIDAIEELEKEFNAARDAFRNTDLQNRLDAIEKEKEAWIDKGVSEAEAEELAQLRIAKVREEYLQKAQDLLQEAADIEYHSTHNALENQIYDIERWKQAQLEKAETAEEVAAIIANAAAKEEAAIQKSLERAKSLMNEAADREYGLTHSAFEKQLHDIERWKQAQLEKAETAEEIAATVANAASREAEAVEQEVNRIKGVMESAQDRLARLRLSQRDYDLYRAQKQYEKDLQELPSVLANELLFAELNRIKGRQDGVSLGYTDKPPQYFKTTSQMDVATVEKIFRDLQARLPSLVRVNPENYARYKAKEELQNAKTTAQIDKATAPFREGLKNAVSSVNDFSKAIQQATAAVRGGNNAPNNSTPATPATDAQNEAFTALSGLLGNGGSVLDHEGDVSVAYLEELNKSLDNLDSSTRDALYAILDKVPEGINVDAIKELIRDNSDGRANIVYLDELEEALRSLPSDVREALQNALNGQPVGTVDVGTVDTDNLQQSFDDLSQSVDSINTPIENLADATQNAGTSTNAFSDELNKTADALDVLREKIANTPIQPLPQEQPQQTPQYDNFSDVFDKALKGTATLGELTALGGLATLQPEIALLGAGIEALANTVQTLRELAKEPLPSQPQPQSSSAPQPDSPTTSVDLSAIQQTLSEVSQTLTAIQQDVTTIQQEPPVDLMPLQEALQQSSSAETSALTEINTSIQATTQAISNAVQQNSQSTSTQLSQIVSEATQAISEAGEKVTQTITEATQEVMQSILSAIETSTQQKIESLAGNIQSVLQAIETSTQQMVQALGIVSQAMADMAQAAREARSSQSQPVNVNVNPNINLGGAYVFDNAMKQQLTNDIATEVINAVTSAVQTATQQANYGYGN